MSVHGNGIGLERRNPVRTLKNAIMPVPVETPWVEMGEGGVEARLGTPIVVGGRSELLRVEWVDSVGWGVSVGESLLIMGKWVI